jgi:SAM-dependent methyltransferase
VAGAEELPFADASFDATLAQLVVQFMTDPLGGVREMARVTRAGGVVAACVWDQTESDGPLPVFWRAARSLDPSVKDETGKTGVRRGDLARLFEAAGLESVEERAISVTVSHVNFEEWWEPFLLGVGPAGTYVDSLDTSRRAALKERCRERLPDPLVLTAVAWSARGAVQAIATERIS